MKKTLFLTFTLVYSFLSFAAKFNITITGEPMYDPAITNARIGDTISIEGSNTHPLTQVSSTNWAAGITDTLAGGWGVKTANYTFVLKTKDTIFFMCQNHGPSGMKARIIVDWGLANNDAEKNPVFTVYSNPGKNLVFKLNEETSKIYTVNVLDLNGKMVSQRLFRIGEMVEIENLKSGVYFVRISGNKKEEYIFKKILISGSN